MHRNVPANARGPGSISGPGRFQRSPCATTTEPHALTALCPEPVLPRGALAHCDERKSKCSNKKPEATNE